jgi:hypothetical protein
MSRTRIVRWWRMAAVLAVCTACGCLAPPSEEELAAILGPALSPILADGDITCDELLDRDAYNTCPATPPTAGTDANGVTWYRDVFFGFLRNPFHDGLDCWRGVTPALGLSGVQCCYDDTGMLVQEGPYAGSFDFVSPTGSWMTYMWHFLLDVLPPTAYGPCDCACSG